MNNALELTVKISFDKESLNRFYADIDEILKKLKESDRVSANNLIDNLESLKVKFELL